MSSPTATCLTHNRPAGPDGLCAICRAVLRGQQVVWRINEIGGEKDGAQQQEERQADV